MRWQKWEGNCALQIQWVIAFRCKDCSSVGNALVIGLTIYCNRRNKLMLGDDGSALKMLPELKQHAKPKQRAQCRKLLRVHQIEP